MIKPNRLDGSNDEIFHQVLSKMKHGGGGWWDRQYIYQIMIGDRLVGTADNEPAAEKIMKANPGSYIWPVER
jgi:hypothetical protein